MNRTTLLTALPLAMALGLAPLAVMADDDDDDRRWRDAKGGPAYSMEELGTLHKARALHRYGPGAQAEVTETERGTHQVRIHDAEGNLLREMEYNRFGQPVRGSDDDYGDRRDDD